MYITGIIDYDEFREIFVEICDQRKELEQVCQSYDSQPVHCVLISVSVCVNSAGLKCPRSCKGKLFATCCGKSSLKKRGKSDVPWYIHIYIHTYIEFFLKCYLSKVM